jgi:hypothetical protein
MGAFIRKGIIFCSIGFALLLVIRLLYGYLTFNQTNESAGNFRLEEQGSQAVISLNKASDKKVYQKDGVSRTQITVEQKFEKIANIRSHSSDFDTDTKKLRDTIRLFNAIIQFEKNTGLKGHRTIDLVIGVKPDRFDDMVAAIKAVGELRSISIDKIDKTSEYKDLNAKRKSLEESIQSLIALKTRGGKIDEYINLENRILEMKKQIQDLGGKLGEYDAENEFCTIKFSIDEKGKSAYSFIRSLIISIQWSVKIYFFLTLSLFFAAVVLWISFLLIKRTGLSAKLKPVLRRKVNR